MQQRFSPSNTPPLNADLVDLDQVFAMARRQWRVVLGTMVAVAIVGLLSVFFSAPRYTSSARILIDSGNREIVAEMSAVGGVLGDETSVLSQVEILRSATIATSVVDQIALLSNRTFLSELGLDASVAVSNPDAAHYLAVSTIRQGLEVQRVGRTYVLDVSYTSENSELARTVAQGFAEAYLTDQLDSKYEATRRVSEWLLARIEELKQKSLDTDLAVQRFRSENGLIATGGELLTEQQLSQLNGQLVEAQANTAEAQAKYESLRQIIDSGQLEALVTDALNSPIISSIRTAYLEASRREADLVTLLGEEHGQVVRLREQIAAYRQQMFDELSRIAESYDSALQIAKARQGSIEASLARATGVTAEANDSLVQLRELEREAESYENLYQTFLQRYQEAVQQQSFPVTEARIISPASRAVRSSARLSSTLIFALGIGAFLGVGVGAVREFRDRYFRTGEQVRSELGLDFLGYLPRIGPQRKWYQLLPSLRGATDHAAAATDIIARGALAAFDDALGNTKQAIDASLATQRPKVVGVSSALAGEGKTTVALNLAKLLAQQGFRTILVDADIDGLGATKLLAPRAEQGLAEAMVSGTLSLENLQFKDAQSGLAFLPAGHTRRASTLSKFMANERISSLVKGIVDFDYVIVDLPAAGSLVDALLVAESIHALVVVTEWGRTQRRSLGAAFSRDSVLAEKCVGVLLNKVDLREIKLYEGH